VIKSISDKTSSREVPEIKQKFCRGELCSNGYFSCSFADKVTAEVIRKDTRYQRDEQTGFRF